MNEQQRLTAEPADERLRRILYTAPEAIVGMDGGGFVTAWNDAARKMFGWSQDEAVGKVLADLIIPPNLRDAHWTGLRRFLDTGEGPVFGRRLELGALHRDGHEIPVELTLSPFETDGLWEFHGFLREISERKRAEAEREALIENLRALARTDDLTDLWNRRAWDEELARELARATRAGSTLCVALLDLDGFKAYNDAHGHQAGDVLLRSVADSWRSRLRITDVLARIGGEEFALAFPAWPLEIALTVVERLRADMPSGQTCSAGLVAWDGQESADELVDRADKALYEAKRLGRARTIFHPSISKADKRRRDEALGTQAELEDAAARAARRLYEAEDDAQA